MKLNRTAQLFVFLVTGILTITPLFGDSQYIFLFQSAQARSLAGLARQKARLRLAREDLRRASELLSSHAIPREEYDIISTAVQVGTFDLEIAELRAEQATIALDLALALARNGQRIPLCRRRRQTDENTVSKLLKSPEPIELSKPVALPDNPGSGTRIDVREDLPKVEKPEEPDPQQPGGESGNPVMPGNPDPGGDDPTIPIQPEPKPNPKPKPGPNPKPNPNPDPSPNPVPKS